MVFLLAQLISVRCYMTESSREKVSEKININNCLTVRVVMDY